MSDEFDPSLLSGYLDGELTAEEASQVRQQLAQRADLRAELESIRDLRAAVAALPLSPADELLVQRVRSRIDQHRERLSKTAPPQPSFRAVPGETSTLKLTLSLLIAASILLAVGWTLWHTADLGGNVALQDQHESAEPDRPQATEPPVESHFAEPQTLEQQSLEPQTLEPQTLQQRQQAPEQRIPAPLAMEAIERKDPAGETTAGEAVSNRPLRRQMAEQDAPPEARAADSQGFSLQMRAQPLQAVPEAAPQTPQAPRRMELRAADDSMRPPLAPQSRSLRAVPQLSKRSETAAEVTGLQTQVLPRRALPWYQASPVAEADLNAGRGAEASDIARRYARSQPDEGKPSAVGSAGNQTPPADGQQANRYLGVHPSSQLVIRRVRQEQVPVVARWWQQRLALPGEGASEPAWDPAEQALAVVGDAESIARLRAEWQDFSNANRLSTQWQSLEDGAAGAGMAAADAQVAPPGEQPQMMAVEFQVTQ